MRGGPLYEWCGWEICTGCGARRRSRRAGALLMKRVTEVRDTTVNICIFMDVVSLRR